MSAVLAYSALQLSCSDARDALCEQLRTRGFARVCIDDAALHRALADAIDDARALDGFRFPPLDEAAVYTPVRRSAFSALYTIAVVVFRALMDGMDCPPELRTVLSRIQPESEPLFGPDGLGHQPFTETQAFSQSFFNLFNYDGGALNPHVDRSLMTVIRVQPGENVGAHQSALWVEGADGLWRNADQDVGPQDVLILIGEDCERIPGIQQQGLKAAAHSVRVDPHGDYIAHSHFRADPDTPTTHNRKSAAFILRHEPAE